ncbi:hypothetical protein N7540_007710 [Penicillium herquei]|nr:hypothetical protein N7540_007710 [Penicillium herquei]
MPPTRLLFLLPIHLLYLLPTRLLCQVPIHHPELPQAPLALLAPLQPEPSPRSLRVVSIDSTCRHGKGGAHQPEYGKKNVQPHFGSIN